MKQYEPIVTMDYGPLDPKVNLEPDFFTGFQPQRREEIVAEEAKFYRGITQPFSVEEELEKRDVTFQTGDGAALQVRIYRPKGVNKNLPALMFFHGGGFMTCSVDTHDYVPSYLAAKAGVMCLSVAYRLAPEHKFPTGLLDCYAACQWAVENAAQLRLDPDRLAVCGDSSGGNFAAAITLLARQRGDLKLWKQVLIYPATEFTGTVEKRSAQVYAPVGGAGDGPSPILTAYLTNPATETQNPLVSPMLAEEVCGLPPALFIVAECDALADDGLIYAKRLQDAGVAVECRVFPGMPHAFILRTYDETFAALDTICAFLRGSPVF